ncbi:MAG: glycosyltransferase [Bacteroidales bacterium]|nr:glycosyltransferase [Bacteroidales bacterium]
MASKILLLGYLGNKSNKKDGQTVKTRQYLELLQRNVGKNIRISTFDTEILHTRPWRIANLLWKTIRADKVVYLPAQNNLRYFFKPLYTLSRIFRFDIIYPLIGGWLPVFLENRPRFARKLGKIKGVFPENDTLARILGEKFGMKNVRTMPNFRFVEYVPQVPSSNPGEFRLVFMSRIVKAKGIDTVFRLAACFSKPEIKQACPLSIDFYGEIAPEDKAYFEQEVQGYGNVCYKGVLEPKDICRTLSGYDALILPTRYPTEGVPGAVIDAYMAGLPVFVSDWLYARDIVCHGKTGYIVPVGEHETETYAEHIQHLFFHQDELDRMKTAAYDYSKAHGEDVAWSILKPFLV